MDNLPSKVVLVNPSSVPVTKALPAIKAVAKDKRLTQKAKLVFLGIYGFTGSDNSKAWPSKKALADTLGMHHQTVTAALQELIQLEYLVTSNFGERIVFHLRPTVDVTSHVVQIHWNAKPENPQEKNQRTLGNDDAKVVNPDTRGVTADDKGKKLRETKKEKEKAPSENRLFEHFSSLSERQKPILLDRIMKSAFEIRKRNKFDGNWEDETARKEFLKLRDFHRRAEKELMGVIVTNWS